jgi:uncharacterized protein (TIGR00255 family)
MNSMTGFGRASADHDGRQADVEVRSVNHRHLEASVRLPRVLADREQAVVTYLRSRFARGKFNVSIGLDADDEATLPRVDLEAARAYGALLRDLARAAGTEPPTVADVLRFSDVLDQPAPEDAPDDLADTLWRLGEVALVRACDRLEAMRAQEGAALRDDLSARVDAIEAVVSRVEERAPQRVDEARTRLTDRLAALMTDERLDPVRLETEVALLADRLDVTEETVRLRAHLRFFREAMASGEAAGRRLNFLAQEIGREINTVGSKANDTEIAHLAVGMKEELEKIREQVQNVE